MKNPIPREKKLHRPNIQLNQMSNDKTEKHEFFFLKKQQQMNPNKSPKP